MTFHVAKAPFLRYPADRTPGHHAVTWVQRDGLIVDGGNADSALGAFLNGVGLALAEMAEEPHALRRLGLSAGELADYTYGTAFYNTVDASSGCPDGLFHYDSGLDRAVHASNAGAPVLRFAGASSTDSHPVQYGFALDPAMYGEKGSSPGTVQPSNAHVVSYVEGTGLHARLASPSRPGAVTVIYSAVLYRDFQPPILIPALRSLPDWPDVYTWRQCGDG